MEEIWKAVPDFEGYYEVSNKGRVRSLDREYEVFDKRWSKTYTVKMKGRVLTPSFGRDHKYAKQVLTKGPQHPNVSVHVHRLVALAFLPNPENKTVVHHIDHDKTNCCVENLMWVTSKENTAFAKEAGLLGPKSKKHRKFTDAQIEWMEHLSKNGYSVHNIADMFNTGVGYVRTICDVTHKPKRHRNKYCFPASFGFRTIQHNI